GGWRCRRRLLGLRRGLLRRAAVTNKALIIAVTRCSKESVDADIRVILPNLVQPVQRASLIGCVLRQLTQNHTHRRFINVKPSRADEPGAIFWIFFAGGGRTRCTRQGRQLRLRPYKRTYQAAKR